MIPFLFQSLFFILKPFFYLFCDFKVSGIENLDKLEEENSGIILASNHASELDPITIGIAMNFISKLRPLYYVAREKEFYRDTVLGRFLYGGVFFKLCGAYPAFPGKHDYAFALSYHLIFLRNKKTVCIFPEGKRNDGFGVIDPKGGIGYLADSTDSIIIPAHIRGTRHASFFKFITGKMKISVVFGKPIYPNDLEKSEYKKNAKMVMDKVYKL